MITRIVKWAGVLTSVIYLYFSFSGLQPMPVQRGTILASFLILAPLSSIEGKEFKKRHLISILLSAVGFLIMIYYIINLEAIYMKVMGPSDLELVMGAILILLILEGTRRTMGYSMVVICGICILYAFFGHYLPGILRHVPLSYDQIIHYLSMTQEGVWGTTLNSAATIIIVFILFGAFLDAFGAGDFFTDLGMKMFGKVRGGPAKISIVTSALFGTISGSPVANVVVTGSFTIPLMKKYGYAPEYAGGVEAASSTGGQIMPPIMGAAAFVMAEVLGISYWEIVKAAIIPAILYFTSIFFMVDFEAGKKGLKLNFEVKEVTIKQLAYKGAHVVIAMGMLIYFMGGMMLSPTRSAFYAIVVLFIATLIQRVGKIKLKEIINALESAARGMLCVVGACASAGIIIGVVNVTGLGVRFSDMLIALAGGNMWVLLIFTMIASIILGMGVPTVAAYIILAVLVAPALHSLGVPLMAAHMFVFYFGVLAPVTPPVALGAYAAAGIAKGDPMKTGFRGLQLALTAFIVPFMFVASPVLMMDGTFAEIARALVTSLVGVFCLASSMEGYMINFNINKIERALLLAAAVMLINPGLYTDIAGAVIISGILFLEKIIMKRRVASKVQ